ncbi:leucine-rich melanocyte differentiation-associated protein [Haematobia irritans]|uniref:leucine-rich melanocyte differentiation-associated protein n=1 Tax=Haematobia irritans TaxID=7368 RepID=UPI003F4FC8D2
MNHSSDVDRNDGWDAVKRELNLSHRNLRELDPQIIATHGECIEHLDVSHNRIRDLKWIADMPHLKSLIMDDNRLREAHFERLKTFSFPTITTLTLNKNEFSDLDTTAQILQQLFPNLEYLSIHGNPICPDNLYLVPFSEFVPYEYTHYRNVLCNSLPRLKFLDHYALDSVHLMEHEHKTKTEQNQPHSISGYFWSKVKSFVLSDRKRNESNSHKHFPPRRLPVYKGFHSEGNRYITNSDL